MKSKWQVAPRREVSHLEIQTDAEMSSMVLVERSLGKSTYKLDPGFLQELIEYELRPQPPKSLKSRRAQQSDRSFSSLSYYPKRLSSHIPRPYTPSSQPNRHVYNPPLKYLLPLPTNRSAYSRNVLRQVPGLAQARCKSYHGSSPAQRYM
jgi:hypothetical protein